MRYVSCWCINPTSFQFYEALLLRLIRIEICYYYRVGAIWPGCTVNVVLDCLCGVAAAKVPRFEMHQDGKTIPASWSSGRSYDSSPRIRRCCCYPYFTSGILLIEPHILYDAAEGTFSCLLTWSVQGLCFTSSCYCQGMIILDQDHSIISPSLLCYPWIMACIHPYLWDFLTAMRIINFMIPAHGWKLFLFFIHAFVEKKSSSEHPSQTVPSYDTI